MAKGNIDSVSLEALGIGNNSQYINSNMNVNLITNSDSGTINNISGTPYNGSIEPIKTDSNTNVLLDNVGIELENPSKGELSKTVKDLVKEEFEKENNKMFTIFGIFASVVAFLLVEVQILKTATSWQILAGISLILLGTMSFFVLLIKVVLSSKDCWRCGTWILFVISLAFIGIGVCVTSKGDNEKYSEEMKIEYSGKLYDDRNFRFH